MVRPTPTTATRTMAITQEDSRLDALATVQQMIGPTTTTSQEMGSSMGNHEIQSTSETEIRLTSPPSVSRITRSMAPVGMATPISQDLIWLCHPDICRAHRDGGSSQGGTRYSLPPARRRGSFNSNDQLNSSTER